MKYFAILTVLLLIVSLIGVGSLYLTSNLVVEATGVMAIEAETQPELFGQLRDQVRRGAVLGTPFVAQGELSDPENYQFYTYTVRLRNDCRIPAEMIELQVSPMPGDILQLGSDSQPALQARATGDVTATILTLKGVHSVREVIVTYYMWGVPFTLRTSVR